MRRNSSGLEFGSDGIMLWERVDPPLCWPAIGGYVIADRHLPDGTRQHMVPGIVAKGLVLNNAQVIGEADCPVTVFSSRKSHLSQWRGTA